MNKKINSVIIEYLQAKNTDYALLLNGVWGSGKTFYIKNELECEIRKQGLKVIYISLNGSEDINKLIKKITFRLLYDLKNESKIDEDIVEKFIEITAELPKIGGFINVGKKIKNIIEIKKLENIDYKNIVLILDDLERISTKIYPEDVLGKIYENYIKNGTKTLFVSDESNIKKEEYKKIKEKIVRRTVLYNPDINIQLNIFLEKYLENHKYINDNKEYIIDTFDKANIRNLRTISFIMDNFLSIINRLDGPFLEKYGRIIFRNIVVLTNEFKKGEITYDDLEDKKGLKHRTISFSGWGSNTDEVREETYSEKFYKTYNDKYKLEFRFINEIFIYIITGNIEIDKLREEIFSIYDLPEQIRTLRTMEQCYAIEENELSDCVNKVIKYLAEGKYSITMLPDISTLLKFYEEHKYLSDWNYDVEKIINSAFDYLSKISSLVPDNVPICGYEISDEKYTKSEYYKELTGKILTCTQNKTITETIIKIFKLAEEGNDDCITCLRNYKYSELFQDIINTGNKEKFISLNNKGIHYFESYLQDNVLKFSVGPSDNTQTKELQIIVNYIKSNLTNISNNMRKQRFHELITTMELTIKHLKEGSKNKVSQR
ncbi:MAG: hypothetical protein LBU51_09175 [Bacteroidales bacterium]|nr:hypothetical protein [Bacteroidales bacterium]